MNDDVRLLLCSAVLEPDITVLYRFMGRLWFRSKGYSARLPVIALIAPYSKIGDLRVSSSYSI